MKNFARQWLEPVFNFSSLLFLVLIHLSVIFGTVIGVALLSWLYGLVAGAAVFLLSYICLVVIWLLNHR